MGHKSEKPHPNSISTSAQRHRRAINQQRKEATAAGKAERDRKRAEAEGERAVLDAEKVEVDEAKLESLRKADGYRRRQMIRQHNKEMVKEILRAMDETPLAEVD
ncbi:hypothetical protein LTR85_004754 [Meristemomyces frigidus]|nr:hypothetical protein LTR85_004754 [Meristemomyces frigidus]